MNASIDNRSSITARNNVRLDWNVVLPSDVDGFSTLGIERQAWPSADSTALGAIAINSCNKLVAIIINKTSLVRCALTVFDADLVVAIELVNIIWIQSIGHKIFKVRLITRINQFTYTQYQYSRQRAS